MRKRKLRKPQNWRSTQVSHPAVLAAVGLVLVLVLAACGGGASATPTPASGGEAGPLPAIPLEQGQPSRGERLFQSVGCIGCHTIKGVGGNVGPDLSEVATRAPDRARAQRLERPELYFVQSVVYPKAFVAPGFTPVMPNWKELQLTENDLADIVAYLKTLTGP